MKNKKTIMCFSALMILLFHLWINVTTNINESLIRQTFIIGVDMFFFISAYGISKKDIKYKDFIFNRIVNIYLKFIILTLLFVIYKEKYIEDFFLTIFGIDLFISGGGSFMWFIPAIMIMYIALPIYKKIDIKYSIITPIVITLIYFGLAIGLSLFTDETAVFIILNRVPIILIGYYVGRYNIIEMLDNKKVLYYMVSVFLTVLGIFLAKEYCLKLFYVEWLYDIKYLLYIPLILGIILLLNKVKDNFVSKAIGSITLELYGLQMIYGYKIANYIFKSTRNALVTNVLVIIILIIASFVFYWLFKLMEKLVNKLYLTIKKKIIS